MVIQTRYFGEIDIEKEKIIHFENGLMGFEQFKEYTILYDIESKNSVISWLQSVEEPSLALPIISPFVVKKDYDPVVNAELIESVGELTEDNVVLFVTMTVPSDIKKMAANLKAPIIINSDNCQGCQIIVDNQDYSVKYEIYELIQKMKNQKGVE